MEELTPEQALRVAARDGDSATVILLLDAGTPVDAADMIGYTPLMLAARKGQTTMLRLLIERGADWKAKNRPGDTALDFAVDSGSVDSVRLLVGLEGEIKGWPGRQLLNSTSHADVKQVLFDAGASNEVAHLDRDEEQAINSALENDETVLCKVCQKPLAYYRLHITGMETGWPLGLVAPMVVHTDPKLHDKAGSLFCLNHDFRDLRD